jgi:hypothetical protein
MVRQAWAQSSHSCWCKYKALIGSEEQFKGRTLHDLAREITRGAEGEFQWRTTATNEGGDNFPQSELQVSGGGDVGRGRLLRRLGESRRWRHGDQQQEGDEKHPPSFVAPEERMIHADSLTNTRRTESRPVSACRSPYFVALWVKRRPAHKFRGIEDTA